MLLNFIVQSPREAIFSIRDLVIAVVTLLTGLIGVFAGAWLSAKIEKKQIGIKNRNNAYTAAILIRNWIREKLDYLINLKGNLTDRLNFIENFDKNNIKILTQDLPESRPLYELDFSLIKDISLMRNLFYEYEAMLQKLSLCNSYYLDAGSVERKFSEMKNELLNKFKELTSKSPEDIAETDFTEPLINFTAAFKRVSPDWIKIIEHHEEFVRKVFVDFQNLICTPLNIEPIGLGGVVTTDKL